ncbi:hypothetical protein PO909_009109 [Leuciscus waleckii]
MPSLVDLLNRNSCSFCLTSVLAAAPLLLSLLRSLLRRTRTCCSRRCLSSSLS